MATIADLHISISDMSDDEIFHHIRYIRSLRREIPVKPIRKTTKKKTDKKQITIEEHLSSMKDVKREELVKRLLEIRGRKHNG